MKTEKEKMLAGEPYLASDPVLLQDRLRARELLQRYNNSPPGEEELRRRLLNELLVRCGESSIIEPLFSCDYGYNIHLGDRVNVNFGCVFLDVCRITIGNDVLIAPHVQLYTATHPLDWKIRHRGGPECGRPITIGDDCWLGGGTIVCPGVSIGKRCVVGAGSVVTKDIPDDSLALGNPARVVRHLEENDSFDTYHSFKQGTLSCNIDLSAIRG